MSPNPAPTSTKSFKRFLGSTVIKKNKTKYVGWETDRRAHAIDCSVTTTNHNLAALDKQNVTAECSGWFYLIRTFSVSDGSFAIFHQPGKSWSMKRGSQNETSVWVEDAHALIFGEKYTEPEKKQAWRVRYTPSNLLKCLMILSSSCPCSQIVEPFASWPDAAGIYSSIKMISWYHMYDGNVTGIQARSPEERTQTSD